MVRSFFCAVCALVLVAGGLVADEIKGKIKTLDTEKKMLTLTVDDKDQDITLTDDTKVVNGKGKDVKGGLKAKGLKEGALVTVTTEKKEGKAVASEIKLGGKK